MTDPNQDPDKDQPAPDAADADWASAFAEQSAGHAGPPNQAEGLQGDDWASALAEQTAAGNASKPPATSSVADLFQPLAGMPAEGESDIDLIMDIPVQLSVELGRTRLTIKNILQLGQGSVVELDGLAGEPMDIFVNGYLIAQGEVVVVDDKYGIRLTDIITPSDRLSRLNGKR
ncbi:flagellar motor switch protein FliN [Pusillimonas sp.]|uniref:flagellar motor switch protein FliN n=1 Tax=Pusillimonas sp. TaxID=3040095 RepID=UPI0029A12BC6|nr:flagellar motor switch protein FliN [Pusillimonas sp.]MDX3894108.1 flagellar motor switch protein FliN [Pusillimonas sp.]